MMQRASWKELENSLRIRGDGIFFRDAAFRSLERNDAERSAHFFPGFFHLLPGKLGKLVNVRKMPRTHGSEKYGGRPSVSREYSLRSRSSVGSKTTSTVSAPAFRHISTPCFSRTEMAEKLREFPLSQSIPFRGLLPPCRAGCIGYALAGRGEIQEFFRFAGCPYLVAARQVCVKIQFLRVEFSGKENGGQGVYLLFNKGFK